ncbi:DUF1876 domain-containing protein [Streptomyces sp. URMC 127]|uniref:DUF1876 domain-containing protein n=1 Tax=unclassified Streptomyces TaxID=2593676 RepID=UPI00267501CE|nr:DUF1876 domain-containing protein [Streptomyces sp. VNUA116]WKU48180.1 DUF1876 domain-containing protein [Streptomyces sp. VNUA116]
MTTEKIVESPIDMEFREAGALTQAAVRLHMHDGTDFTAVGTTNRNPADPSQQRVGEEVAAARALRDLSEQLLDKAGVDIEEATHVATRLNH